MLKRDLLSYRGSITLFLKIIAGSTPENDFTGSSRSKYVHSGKITSDIITVSLGIVSIVTAKSKFSNICFVFAIFGTDCIGFCLYVKSARKGNGVFFSAIRFLKPIHEPL